MTAAETPDPAAVEAFSALYRAHLAVIVRYLTRRLGPDAAEDAAAEVFVRAFRQRDTYEARHPSPLPWLYGIAVNVIAEHRVHEHRRLKTMQRLASQRPIADDPPSSSGTLDPSVLRALRRLTRADRETLLLVAWGELTYEETAAALNVPVGTVRSRLARARAQIDLKPRPRPTTNRLPSMQGDQRV